MKNETKIGRIQFDSIGAKVKHRAKQAWNWTKDHAVPLAIGTAAAVGGGYLLYRHGKGDDPEEPQVIDPGEPEDLSWTRDFVEDRWNQMENPAETIGPSEEDP